jgi:hypothetical protein
MCICNTIVKASPFTTTHPGANYAWRWEFSPGFSMIIMLFYNLLVQQLIVGLPRMNKGNHMLYGSVCR